MKREANHSSPILIFLLVFILQSCAPSDRPTPTLVIKSRLHNTSQAILVPPDTLYAQSQLRQLYQLSENQLIWRQYTTDPTRFKNLIEIIESTVDDGLNPSEYHLNRLSEYQHQINSNHMRNLEDVSRMVDTDFLLSDAFLTLAFHLYAGRVQRAEMNNDWDCHFNEKNLTILLWEASSTDSIKEALSTLHPPYPQYQKLRTWLERNRNSLNTLPNDSLTREQKNKIVLSLERWRWLPKSTDSTFLTVNIPAFLLAYHSRDSILISMKTIVGTLENPTPVFNCEISYIILRPRWNVPSTILEEEILPRALIDTSYLTKNHFRILKTWQDNDTSFIMPDSILWDSVTVDNFPYRMVQTSGFWNPLGKIKFMFPNQYEVYLHDTPNHTLFDHEIRTFSHGCIRVEKAMDLAVILSQNDSLRYPHLFKENERWDLSTPVPIFINYWTAWHEDDSITFYDDVYSYDSLMQLEMGKAPFRF